MGRRYIIATCSWHRVLEEFVGKMFTDWTNSVERELDRLLEKPLSARISNILISLCVYVVAVFWFWFYLKDSTTGHL